MTERCAAQTYPRVKLRSPPGYYPAYCRKTDALHIVFWYKTEYTAHYGYRFGNIAPAQRNTTVDK